MATWKRLPQECSGDYFFSGRALMTRGVEAALSPEEIALVVADLQAFVQQENGVDYLQCYEADDGRRAWCIDQLRQSVKDSDEFTPEQLAEYDHWTILLPDEY